MQPGITKLQQQLTLQTAGRKGEDLFLEDPGGTNEEPGGDGPPTATHGSPGYDQAAPLSSGKNGEICVSQDSFLHSQIKVSSRKEKSESTLECAGLFCFTHTHTVLMLPLLQGH